MSLNYNSEREVEKLGALDRELGYLFADATLSLLTSASIEPTEVQAIGSHGQTVRHRPACAGHAEQHSFTLQIGDPNTIAEVTGITTVADFRKRDIAAGGEGAPLAPAFHANAFGKHGTVRGIVNIGGIANLSLLDGETLVAGFDTGPGNTLMDSWIALHQSKAFDRDGQWAASGTTNSALLEGLMQHPFLSLEGPRSTGKEVFNAGWLQQALAPLPAMEPADVQATLAQFTATTIANALRQAARPATELYVCGGGAHNGQLVKLIEKALPGISVDDTSALGMHPDWVEAVTFAWLAQQSLAGLPGNAPVVTGARGPRVLGAIYAGSPHRR